MAIKLTEEQQADTFGRYLPSGAAFDAWGIPGTVVRALLKGLGVEASRADELICEFRDQTIPDQTTQFLAEWERALQIPDACFTPLGATDDARRADILTKLAALGTQTADDFVALALILGFTVTVQSGATPGVFPITFPAFFPSSAEDARFTVLVEIDGAGSDHTWNWLWSFGPALDGHPWSDPDVEKLKCLFQALIPANCQVLFLTSGAT